MARNQEDGVALFLSTYINKVDAKGRASIPALYRQALAAGGEQYGFNGVVLFRSYKLPCLEACGVERMALLSESVDRLDMFSDAQDDLTATIFADARQLALDGDGRISLPPELAAHASITDKIAFVGRGPTFQLWQPEAFEVYQQQARARALQTGATLSLRPPAGGV